MKLDWIPTFVGMTKSTYYQIENGTFAKHQPKNNYEFTNRVRK